MCWPAAEARPDRGRPALALPRPDPGAAVRAGQARPGAVGRRRASPARAPALGWWRELATPLFPVVGLLFVLVGYNDLGTMLVLLAHHRRPALGGRGAAAGLRRARRARPGRHRPADRGGVARRRLRCRGEENYRLARLTTFLDTRPRTATWTPATRCSQGRSAIYDGGWFGVGLGKSASSGTGCRTADNDFIFAVIAEELGVVGCVVVLAPVRGAGLHRPADRPPGRRPVPPARRDRRSPPGWSPRR